MPGRGTRGCSCKAVAMGTGAVGTVRPGEAKQCWPSFCHDLGCCSKHGAKHSGSKYYNFERVMLCHRLQFPNSETH